MKTVSLPYPHALFGLIQADFLIQWRNKRALLMNIFIPIALLFLSRTAIEKGMTDGLSVLAVGLLISLPATGLLRYSQAVARDRDRGVFQRLRAAPIPTWTIMSSRILVQLCVILLLTITTYLFAVVVDHVSFNIAIFLLTLLIVFITGAAFVALGQLLVGLIKSSEFISTAGLLLYFPLILGGLLAESGLFGPIVKYIAAWSPFGTSSALLVAATHPGVWTGFTWIALAATIAYAICFSVIGIRWFRWNPE